MSITPTKETGGVKPVLDELYAKAIVLQKDAGAIFLMPQSPGTSFGIGILLDQLLLSGYHFFRRLAKRA